MLRNVFTLLLMGVFCGVYGQDTLYYNNLGKEIPSSENCYTYDVIYHNAIDTDKVLVKHFDCSVYLISETHYSDYKKRILDGESKYFYMSGQLHWKIDYKTGKFNGKRLSYYENGKLKREDIFEDNLFISGKCFGVDGSDTTYYEFEKMPQYPGGEEELFKYLQNEVKYPKKSRRKGITGKVYINFEIDKDGNVSNVSVVKSVDSLLDAEALRAVQLMPRWTPGYQDGVPVRVQYNLPINFTLK
jgi:protein TonB